MAQAFPNLKPTPHLELTQDGVDKPLLKINENGSVNFLNLTFNEEVANSILKGKSFIISQTESGWTINNKLVENPSLEVIIETAKNCLTNSHNPTIKEIYRNITEA